MTRLLLTIIILLLNFVPALSQCGDYKSNMSSVESYANDAYSYARKAYYADNLEDAQYYANKSKSEADGAMRYAESARDKASDCDCDAGENYASNAYYAADDAYLYARKAYNADNLEDAQHYSKKAMNAASNAEEYAANGRSYCD